VLGITTFNTILYVGLTMTTSTNALIINSSVPLLLSFLILEQEMTLRQTFGIILSTLGVIYLILKGDLNTFQTLEFNQGDIWIIISSLTWALYSVLVRFKPKEFNDFEYFSTIVALGFVVSQPIDRRIIQYD